MNRIDPFWLLPSRALVEVATETTVLTNIMAILPLCDPVTGSCPYTRSHRSYSSWVPSIATWLPTIALLYFAFRPLVCTCSSQRVLATHHLGCCSARRTFLNAGPSSTPRASCFHPTLLLLAFFLHITRAQGWADQLLLIQGVSLEFVQIRKRANFAQNRGGNMRFLSRWMEGCKDGWMNEWMNGR